MTDSGKSQDPAQAAYAAGAAAYDMGQLDEAARHLSRAALLAPGSVQVLAHLGVTLRRLKKVHAAIACYRRALAMRPKDASLWSNLGNALRDIDRLAEAEQALRRAVSMAPDNNTFCFNLALVLRDRRQVDEAHDLFQRLVDRNPERPDYVWDLALTRLLQGDYASGFAGYESRWGLERSPPRQFPGRRWAGEDLTGKTLFLHAEQGFGDALQFVRFVPQVRKSGTRVVLECMPELQSLFAIAPGVDAVIEKGAPPPAYDYWLPLLSLPHVLGTTIETLPARVPYLRAPLPRQALPASRGRIKVGLCWAGKLNPRDRSWPLDMLLVLMGDPRVTFYSLQKGDRRADMAELGTAGLLIDLDAQMTDFAATAAILTQLDLVITIDTALAHLAGALGRPCWVLLRYVSDWRWFNEPSHSIWYPTMRLFRQKHAEDWIGPVAELRKALAEFRPASP
jgi:tetratricopeptide (TPR) repeat protein